MHSISMVPTGTDSCRSGDSTGVDIELLHSNFSKLQSTSVPFPSIPLRSPSCFLLSTYNWNYEIQQSLIILHRVSVFSVYCFYFVI